ncbi:alpha/beta hydrolase [Sulfitobacter sp. TSTF-M16]|uniref:Alpha/beta hydrolase n=2 Tax=Sulfitobacter aestuariivivens TaxID=2766981 RepID=A0A927HDB4_9RHOB|nr:alpha/beta hydrolase [Sulfitobacter aestuariivivens]
MWAFIDKVNALYPPGAVDFSIEEQRALYNDVCRVFYQGRPAGVSSWDEDHGGVPCRRYELCESDVTLIYLHGGGNVVGDLDSHDDVCAEICDRTGYRVIAVDYGLAPEVVYPGCFNDGWSAFTAVAEAFDGHLMLAGDSAGGTLAAAIVHHARRRVAGRIIGQILIYPSLGGDMTRGSFVRYANAPHLTTQDVIYFIDQRLGGAEPPKGDGCFAPLQDAEFSGLPPTVCISAQCDPLAGEGETYCDKLRAAGGRAEWINVPGMVHGCLRARGISPAAAGFFDTVVEAIDALGQGRWPYQ